MSKVIPYKVYIQEFDELMGNEYLFSSTRSLSKIFPEILKELRGQYEQLKYSLEDQISDALSDVEDKVKVEELVELAMADDVLAKFIVGDFSFGIQGGSEGKQELLKEGIGWEFWREVTSFLREKSTIELVKTEAKLLGEFKEAGKKFVAATISDDPRMERFPSESVDIAFALNVEPALESLKVEQSGFYAFLEGIGGIQILKEKLSIDRTVRVEKTLSFYKNTHIFIF